MLFFEHLRKQLILAGEVEVERAFRHRCRGGDLVHGDAVVTLATKQLVGSLDDACVRGCTGSRHGISPITILTSEFTLLCCGLKWARGRTPTMEPSCSTLR